MKFKKDQYKLRLTSGLIYALATWFLFWGAFYLLSAWESNEVLSFRAQLKPVITCKFLIINPPDYLDGMKINEGIIGRYKSYPTIHSFQSQFQTILPFPQ